MSGGLPAFWRTQLRGSCGTERPEGAEDGLLRCRMDADPAPVTGHDAPAFRQAEPQSPARIATREERVEGVFAFSGRQLRAVVEQVQLQPVPALPRAVPHAQADPSALPDGANGVPQQLDEDDLELFGVEG